MKNDFSLTLTVDQTPEQVFEAIANVRGWWSKGLVGASSKVGDVFTYRHLDLHESTHEVIEAVPGTRMVWRTTDANLSHSPDPGDWKGTLVRFEIAPRGAQTEMRFTHEGLSPELGCYESCARGWSYYVGESLRRLIETGEGKPDAKEKAGKAA